MGEIGEFREVRVVGIAEEEKRRQGQLHKALWVLVVDNHHQESDWSHSYDPPNRDWTAKSDKYTAMAQGSTTTRGDDDWKYTGDIVVSMFAGARAGYLNVRRNGAWIRLEEYWPYPANSPHHEVHADGCNNSGSDGEDTSNELEEEELDLNSTD